MVVIKGPAQVHGTVTEAQHRRAWEASLRRRALKPWLYVGPPAPVHVSQARLCLDCPNCGGGVMVSREWRSALCRGCGAEFTAGTIQIPDDAEWTAAEDALAVRPERYRNWYPHGLAARDRGRLLIEPESIGHLEAENADRGFPRTRRQPDGAFPVDTGAHTPLGRSMVGAGTEPL